MTNLLIIDKTGIQQFQRTGLLDLFAGACPGLRSTSTACCDFSFSSPVFVTDQPAPGKFYIETPDEQGISDAFRMCARDISLTFEDCTVLVSAYRQGLTLVTNDPCVKKAAERHDIQVCDYLRAVLLMVGTGVISLTLAPQYYRRLMLLYNPSLTLAEATDTVNGQYEQQTGLSAKTRNNERA